MYQNYTLIIMNLTKRKILRHAIRLFISNGIQNTSLADIASSSKISKGTLYYHFASKDDIIMEIAAAHFRVITFEVSKCVKAASKQESQIVLINQIVKRISSIGTRGKLHMYLICEAITENQVLRERFRVFYYEWKSALKYDFVHYFDWTEEDAQSISILLIAIVDGLVVQSLLGNNNLPFENISSLLIKKLI